MKTTLSIIGAIILIIVAGFFGYQGGKLSQKQPVGSVSQGNEYHSTIVKAGGVKSGVMTTYPATLGSIIVPTTMAGILNVYDATTTDATKRATAATTSLTVIGFLDAGTTAGTYTFDVFSAHGLMYDYGTISSSTITWR